MSVSTSAVRATTPSGTAFPSQPGYGNYRLFRRTDLGVDFFYDGSRWVAQVAPSVKVYAANSFR